MINAKITIKEIHYGQSFENLFPMGMQKCRKMENPNRAVRFLLKTGDNSMTAVLGILEMMTEKSKGEVLCRLVNLYCREIQSALNAVLQKDEMGKNIDIGDIYMAQDYDGRLTLIGRDIKVDYGSLAKNDTVKQKIGEFANHAVQKTAFGGISSIRKVVADGAGLAAEVAAGVVPKAVEKKVLSVMNKEENKGRLLPMAEQVLDEKGLSLKLEDVVFMQEESSALQSVSTVESEKERKFELSGDLEEELLDAVAGYLKMLLENSVSGCNMTLKS